MQTKYKIYLLLSLPVFFVIVYIFFHKHPEYEQKPAPRPVAFDLSFGPLNLFFGTAPQADERQVVIHNEYQDALIQSFDSWESVLNGLFVVAESVDKSDAHLVKYRECIARYRLLRYEDTAPPKYGSTADDLYEAAEDLVDALLPRAILSDRRALEWYLEGIVRFRDEVELVVHAYQKERESTSQPQSLTEEPVCPSTVCTSSSVCCRWPSG